MAKGNAPTVESVFKGSPPTYREQTGLDEPYAIRPWSLAFAQLDTRRLKTESNPAPQRYTFPPASMFAQTNPQREQLYLCNWLHIRRLWKNQMRLSTGRVLRLTTQTWKDTLLFGLGGPAGEHTKIDSKNMRKIQEDFAKADLNVSSDGRVITFDNGEQLVASNSRVTGAPDARRVSWRDFDFNLAVEQIPGFAKREIMWELHELNFRFDLIHLDQVMYNGPDDEYARQDRLCRCWGTPHDVFYDPVDIEWTAQDVGLASHQARNRLPYLRSLVGLCETWTNFPLPHSMSEIWRHGMDGREIESLEVQLYCALEQTYYDLFLRPMVPPRSRFAAE